MMNVYSSCCLGITLLLTNIIGRCHCQPTHGMDMENCNEGDWPSNKVLVAMVDQLRDHLIASTDNMQAEIQQLTKQNQKLTTDNQQFTTQIQQLTTDNQQFTTQIQELTTDNQQFTTQIQELTTDNQQCTTQIQQLKGDVSNLKKKHHQSAFSAYMNVGFFQPVNDTRITVPFNGVDYNLGGNYNSRTSVYTCPVNGVYFFMYTIYSASIRESGRDRAYAYIVVGNKQINAAFCYTQTSDYIYCQGTNSVTTHCSRGSLVHVKTYGVGSKVQIYGTSVYDRTTFTGFLLYAN